MRSMRHDPRGNRNGYALLTALWFVTVTATLTMVLAAQSRRLRLMALNTIELTRLDMALDGALELARSRLAGARSRSDSEGESREAYARRSEWGNGITIGTVRVRMELSDVDSRVNLNLASAEQLEALARACGFRDTGAGEFARTVIALRSGETQPAGRLANEGVYEGTTADVHATSRRIRAEEDVLEVEPTWAEYMGCMRPAISVFGSGALNVNSAGRAALMSLPGFDDETADVVLAGRASGRSWASLDEVAALLSFAARRRLSERVPDLSRIARFTQQDAALALTAESPSGAARIANAWLRPTAGTVEVLAVWRR